MKVTRRALLPALALLGACLSAWALTLEEPPRAQAEPTPAAQATPAPTEQVKEAPDKPSGEPRLDSAPAKGRAPRTFTLRTEVFEAELSEQGAGLVRYTLRDARYVRDGAPINLVTTDRPVYLPLHQRIAEVMEPDDSLLWEGTEVEGGVRLRAQAGPLELTRKLIPGRGEYQLWSTLRVRNGGESAQKVTLSEQGHHYVPRDLESGGLIAGRSPFVSSGTCYVDEAAEMEDREEIVENTGQGTPLTYPGPVSFGAVDNIYFTQAIAAHGTEYKQCQLQGSDRGGSPSDPHGALLSVVLEREPVELSPGESHLFRTLYYLGPKTPDLLANAGHHLRSANNVGGIPGINGIAQGLAGLLTLIHEKVGNWGLAIILLTFVVKLVLYPLTAKSFESMAAMRRLKPEIDALNERYANDREKKGSAMMDLYRKHKINPLGGCLPQLLQLPIWAALYMSLSTNVELFRQPFVGFWQDLTAPDPYYVLPLGLGVLMFLQQKLTPTTMDPAQAKMMLYMMPTMITAFMLFLPAGLCLYMFTNSVLTIGQQRVIEYRLNAKAEPVGSGGDDTATPTPAIDSAKRRKRRGRA